VTIIQNLKVKGTKDIKKWTAVKNIRLISDDNEVIEGRVDGVVMVLKTCFIKKLTKKK
jgi:protein PhnA